MNEGEDTIMWRTLHGVRFENHQMGAEAAYDLSRKKKALYMHTV